MALESWNIEENKSYLLETFLALSSQTMAAGEYLPG